MNLDDKRIAIIGLGYVGLPLAIEFGKKFKVLGFDINQSRIEELNLLTDRTNEADLVGMKNAMELAKSNAVLGLNFSANVEDLKNCNVFIVTVPTPIDQFKAPDLTPLLKASEMLGRVIKIDDIVIYESTVYPGCTEEDCVPVLEKYSGLKFNQDFYCGYSPERINPGDKVNTLTKIKRWNYFKNLININDFEKVKIERINKKSLFDLVHNAFLISFENKRIVYAPHGFKSLNKHITANVLITSCSTYHLPWYLGGTINLGINKALSMAELLSTSIILSTHDEQKIGKGIVEKIAKKIPIQENKKIIILERGRELIIE